MRARVSLPPRADWRDYLNSQWALALATFVFIALTIYAYRDMVALDPYLNASGFSALIPAGWMLPISVMIALIPLAWIRRKMDHVSDFCVLYLYFFVYVPSCVMLPYTSFLNEDRQITTLLILLLAFGAIELRRLLPLISIPKIQIGQETNFRLAMIALVVVQCFVILELGNVSLQNISFIDVYDSREAYLADNSSIRVLVGYVSNWAALSVAPIMLIYGLHHRRYLFAGLGLVAAFLAFAATSFKSHLFVPLVIGGLYFLFRATGVRRTGIAVVVLALSITVMPILLDLVFNDRPAATWMIQFRFIGNNGFLTAQYFNVFETMPRGYYADSIGRFWFEPPYNVPIAQVVGESFSPLRGNHANANLWADGYGNLGPFGVMFATVELIVFLWLADSVSRGQDLNITAPIMLSASFVLGNTAVHSMLTSNGGLFLLLLLAALPYAARLTARQPPSKLGFSRP